MSHSNSRFFLEVTFGRMLKLLLALAAALLATFAHAQNKQDEVFRAIQENMAKSTDPVPLLIFLAITATSIVIIALVVNRKTSPAVPKVVHSHAKLNRQMLKLAQINQADWTDAAKRAAEVGAQSPLTVLLCQSLQDRTKSQD